MGFPLGAIDFGGDHDDGDRVVAVALLAAEFLLAEHLGDLFVARRDADLRIDRKQHEVGRADGLGDLPLDLLGEQRQVLTRVVVPLPVGDVHAEAAGVDDLDIDALGLALGVFEMDDRAYTVARHAGQVIDDRDLLPGEQVHERAFADVWSAHNGNTGKGHGSIVCRCRPHPEPTP